MKNVVSKISNYPMYLGIFFLMFTLTACSDDDDGVAQIDPTGSFDIEEEYTLTGNTIILESITVGQDSWLVAVYPEDENSNDFLNDPVMLEDGTNTNVQLIFDADAISDDDGTGQQVVLKIYADNQTQGTTGIWDVTDEPLMGTGNALLKETIIVYAEDDNTSAFANLDTNSDGVLDSTEFPNAFENNFAEWDTDGDDMLDQDEFNATTFSLTDTDDDEGISEEEWDQGFSSFYGNWNDDDFATFDVDGDGNLTSDEWNDAFADSDWFGTFDANADTTVDENEWNTGLFNDWDANDDAGIDEDEFNSFSPFTNMW